eukprot:TRINITY_DN7067_c0_g1_i2.p1 TRINITY_DN7067_c0_g1~~TRINITY_DN7067_c0_g1_i2.p1  ORF type:complete len:468 (-),score=95.49 TRINITY_DN7067_c0_g1_i2:58-1461(-)
MSTEEKSNGDSHSHRGYCIDPEINSKVSLWNAAPQFLSTDALAVPVHSSFEPLYASAKDMFQESTVDLARRVDKSESAQFGEMRVTDGWGLPAKKIYHVVSPEYRSDSQTSSENNLHLCYRNCMALALESLMQIIAFLPLHSTSRAYPPLVGANVALRTIRRFIEKHKDKVMMVILVSEDETMHQIYSNLLSLYFPKDEQDLTTSAALLSHDQGDENGELRIPERAIRITEGPKLKAPSNVPRTGVKAEQPVQADFLRMRAEQDKTRIKEIQRQSLQNSEEQAKEKEFERLYRQAAESSIDGLITKNIIYHAGFDRRGLPVLTIIPKHLHMPSVSSRQLRDLFIRSTYPYLNKPFSVLYAHTQSSAENFPDLEWMRDVSRILPRKILQNMKRLYILHPTIALKAVMFVASAWIGENLDDKIQHLESIMDLQQAIGPAVLLPSFLQSGDETANEFTGEWFVSSVPMDE